MSDFALFVVAPYVAVAILLAGTLSTLLDQSSRRRPARPEVAARILVNSHRVLAIGLLGVSMGHAVILTSPGLLASWMRTPGRTVVLELGLFLLGLTTLAGLVPVIARHVRRTPQHPSAVIDVAFVGVLLVAIVSGLSLAVRYRWAAAWSSVTLAPYVRSVVSFQPDLRLLESMPYLVELHVFSSSVLIALLPFTTPMRLCLSAARRAIDRALAPVGAAFGGTWRLLQERVRQGGHTFRWSAEDEYD
jgi:nitrate reductase gamma subunit